MTRFLVRSVSKGAGGRPITRERVYDAAKISIGRHPGSEVHLPDLNVALYHATMTAQADGTVTVDSPVLTIDPSVGAEINYGDHRLLVSRGQGGEIVVDVANVAPEPPPPRDERRLFTLAGVAPGKRAMAWMLSLAIIGAFIAWPVWSFLTPAQARPARGIVADTAWSPGPLSAAHAGLETNCRACHTQAFTAVTDTTCKGCHTAIHDHADPRRLMAARPDLPLTTRFRQAVATTFGRPPGRCVDCHDEHHGPTQTAASTPQQFCADCHAALRTKLPDTQIGNAGDFARAHPQFRPAVLRDPETLSFARASLDANPRENNGLKFPHALHLSAGNAVAQMARRQRQGARLDCADCHTANADGSFRPVTMEANCQSCHSLAIAGTGGATRTLRHGDPAGVIAELRDFYALRGPVAPTGMSGGRRRPGDFAAANLRADFGDAVAGRGGQNERAVRAVFQPGGLCFDCHTVTPVGTGLNYRVAPVSLPQRYLLKGWFDHRAHRTQTCVGCHAANGSNSSADLLLPRIAECRTCHAGDTAHAGQVRSTCAMCHSYHMDPAGAAAPDPRRRGIALATGMPQVVRRPRE